MKRSNNTNILADTHTQKLTEDIPNTERKVLISSAHRRRRIKRVQGWWPNGCSQTT